MVAGAWLLGGAGLGCAGLGCGERQRPDLTPGVGADTVGAGPGAGSGAGGAGADGGAGGQGGAQTPRGAAGVTLNDIVLYQGPARTLLKDRLEVSDGPTVVAGRPALLRLFYVVDGGYDEEPVSVRVTIGEHHESQQLTLKEGTSSEADLSSTINFAIPKDILETDITIVVAIEQDGPDDNLAARYPTGDEDFTIAVTDGHTMRVVIVPLRYDGDGSERLPDTSQARLDSYRDILMSMYPLRDVDLSVRTPVPYGSILLPNNPLTYQDLRSALANQRQLDAVDDDVFYYGVIQPTATQAAFCNAGCTAGTSFIAAENTSSQHVAVGLTWPDFDRVIAHELGHTLGRTHPGCDVIQEDLNYPHVNATLGGYGYDIIAQQLHPPSDFSIMSYCQPAFVSAYGWGLWYARFVVVYGTAR